MNRQYKRRHAGDIIENGAVLIEKINPRLWRVKCACGDEFITQPSSTSGRCKECGYRANSKQFKVHGESHGSAKTRLYNIWACMRDRCNNPNEKGYKWYGGRGIKVCDEWNSYPAFKKWAAENGYNDALTIGRIDVNGDYSPANCRWSTMQEQCNNRRNNHYLTFNGETMSIAGWARETGISQSAIRQRVNIYGWSVDEALTIPSKKGNNQCLRHPMNLSVMT